MKALIAIERKRVVPVIYLVCISTILCIKFRVFDGTNERIPPESSWYKIPQNTGQLDMHQTSKFEIK